jgi:DNA-directed RNA polymerase subunit K/omega
MSSRKKQPIRSRLARDDESEFDGDDDKQDDIEENEENLSETSEEELSEAESLEEMEDLDKDELVEDTDAKVESTDHPSCIYKIKTKKKLLQIDDALTDIDLFEEESSTNQTIVAPEDRITKPILTKFERVRIIGDRCAQITLGAKPMLKNYEGLSPREIANLELKNKTLPIIIQRQLPSGQIELWKVKELMVVN